jgi:hypothetical protein
MYQQEQNAVDQNKKGRIGKLTSYAPASQMDEWDEKIRTTEWWRIQNGIKK